MQLLTCVTVNYKGMYMYTSTDTAKHTCTYVYAYILSVESFLQQ